MLRKIISALFLTGLFDTASALKKQSMDTLVFKQSLAKQTDHLYFMSESEYPFEVLDWGKLTTDEIKAAVAGSYPPGAPIENIPAGAFFQKTIRNFQLSEDEQMKTIARRYKELETFISSNSSGATVWRCGKIEVGVFIVITAKDGTVIVLKTTSIET